MGLLERLEILIEADATQASRSFARIGADAEASLGDVEKMAGQSGTNAGNGFGDGFLGSLANLPTDIDGLMESAMEGIPPAMIGPAALAGAAVGAYLVTGVTQALEMGQIESRFEAALGANEDTARRLGALAGDIYSDNFGESLQQVGESIRLVSQNFAGLGDLSEAEFEQVNEMALSTAAIFDQDLRMTINAVAQLLRTGLAANAEEAFDIITKGLQGPANKADDLLETFNEYSVQFQKLGLDGEEALGLISQGVQNGARDADKAADALKEFSIRAVDGSATTARGFEDIGLSAETMSARIAAGGDSARNALDLTLDRVRAIEDPVKRAQVAVALFGTHAEDLGAALYAMDLDTAAAQLGRVDGAAADAAGSMDDLSSKVANLRKEFQNYAGSSFVNFLAPLAEAASDDRSWTGMRDAVNRNLEQALEMVPFGRVLEQWGDLAAGTDLWGRLFGGEVPQLPKDNWLWDVLNRGNNGEPLLDIEAITAAAGPATVSLQEINREIELSNSLFGLAADRADSFLSRLADSSALDDAISSQLALRDASAELFDGLGALAGVDIEAFAAGTLQVSDEAAAALGDIGGAASAAQQQIADALQFQGQDAAVAKADSLRASFVNMFDAAGLTDDQINDLLGSMGLLPEQITTAIELSGADEALAKLDLLQGRFDGTDGRPAIPPVVQTQVDIAIAEGRFVDAANLLSLWVKDQEDGYISDPLLVAMGLGPTDGAQAEVDGFVNRNNGRDINIDVITRFTNEGVGAFPIFGRREKGGPVTAGTPYIVGEKGPELFMPTSGGYVANTRQTADILGGSGGRSSGPGVVIQQMNITTADPILAGSEVARRMRDASYLTR